MFDLDCEKPYKIKKPIRLIELFGGIGSQAKALENLQANFTHYRLCEFDKYAVTSYNAIHKTSFLPSDITKLSAKDLGITETAGVSNSQLYKQAGNSIVVNVLEEIFKKLFYELF